MFYVVQWGKNDINIITLGLIHNGISKSKLNVQRITYNLLLTQYSLYNNPFTIR